MEVRFCILLNKKIWLANLNPKSLFISRVHSKIDNHSVTHFVWCLVNDTRPSYKRVGNTVLKCNYYFPLKLVMIICYGSGVAVKVCVQKLIETILSMSIVELWINIEQILLKVLV